MQQLLTMQQIKHRFQVKDNRTIHKFIKQGLKFIKIGTDPIDQLERFEEQLKDEYQIEIKPIKQKRKCKTITIDEEKRKINLTQLKVV